MNRAAAALVGAIAMAVTGGCANTSPPGTIPAYIGVPAQILTPTSLEAEAWRSQHAIAAPIPDSAWPNLGSW